VVLLIGIVRLRRGYCPDGYSRHNGVTRRRISDDEMLDELTAALNGSPVLCAGECRHVLIPGAEPCPNGFFISPRAMGVLLA
jgi:hypothetical protein